MLWGLWLSDQLQSDNRAIESFIADLRFGIRYFASKPLSTLTMVVVFALGIGLNTALFLFLYSFVNSPPPGMTREPSLVRIRGIDRSHAPPAASSGANSRIPNTANTTPRSVCSAPWLRGPHRTSFSTPGTAERISTAARRPS